MILPIVFYGNPILRKKSLEISFSFFKKKKKELDHLIVNMFHTVNQLNGLGIAAPQIGKNIRLFILNTPMENNSFYKEVFFNAKIIKIYGKEYVFNEGCLSIPGINAYIKRKSNILIEYLDKNWEKKKKSFNGMCARIILHEYDHIEGRLFVDYLTRKKRNQIAKKIKKNRNIYFK